MKGRWGSFSVSSTRLSSIGDPGIAAQEKNHEGVELNIPKHRPPGFGIKCVEEKAVLNVMDQQCSRFQTRNLRIPGGSFFLVPK